MKNAYVKYSLIWSSRFLCFLYTLACSSSKASSEYSGLVTTYFCDEGRSIVHQYSRWKKSFWSVCGERTRYPNNIHQHSSYLYWRSGVYSNALLVNHTHTYKYGSSHMRLMAFCLPADFTIFVYVLDALLYVF